MESEELKKIATQFTLEQIEQCIARQVSKGENLCAISDDSDKILGELSKAIVIRELMDQGLSFSQALRELGKRIRAVYASEDRN